MSNTGRFMVVDFKTGKVEKVVEPVSDFPERNSDWGKTDTTNLPTGGSVKPEDSIITEENGFKNIRVQKSGCSID